MKTIILFSSFDGIANIITRENTTTLFQVNSAREFAEIKNAFIYSNISKVFNAFDRDTQIEEYNIIAIYDKANLSFIKEVIIPKIENENIIIVRHSETSENLIENIRSSVVKILDIQSGQHEQNPVIGKEQYKEIYTTLWKMKSEDYENLSNETSYDIEKLFDTYFYKAQQTSVQKSNIEIINSLFNIGGLEANKENIRKLLNNNGFNNINIEGLTLHKDLSEKELGEYTEMLNAVCASILKQTKE